MFHYWSLNWASHLPLPVVTHQVAAKGEKKIDRTMNGLMSTKKGRCSPGFHRCLLEIAEIFVIKYF